MKDERFDRRIIARLTDRAFRAPKAANGRGAARSRQADYLL
jgi:hypothetical protein